VEKERTEASPMLGTISTADFIRCLTAQSDE
jgi:hypothetical protein